MGFSIETGISAFTVFMQGLLSFFSPCVLPLVPLYLGYLSGGLNTAVRTGENSEKNKDRLKLFLRVLFFTVGIGSAFFILGLGASAAGSFFHEQRMLFARVEGILVVLFGLYQLGVFGSSKVLGSEHRFPIRLEKMTMSPITAFIMGFAFSFAWTPCVGPALTSVLLMAGSAESGAKGFLLIGVYTIGFILPFLLAGIFTARLLDLFKKHMKIVRYTVKIGGVLMVLMGLLMFTGKMNDITGYLSSAGQKTESGKQENGKKQDEKDASGGDEEQTSGKDTSGENASGKSDKEEKDQDSEKVRAHMGELKDQFGKSHKLEDYKGKVIFLNFWATWCGPCRSEMPEIQKLYEEYTAMGNDSEVVILGVAGPGIGQEGTVSDITKFMEENGYTYPVLMDETGELFEWYGISAFPTTYMIDHDGNLYGYVTGQLTEDIMRSIIKQTLEGKAP